MLQYEKGLVDYQPVLDTERDLVRQQDEVAQSRGQVAVNLVAVYKALAGGWKVRNARGGQPGCGGGPDSLAIGAAEPQEELPYARKASCAYGTPIGKLSGPPVGPPARRPAIELREDDLEPAAAA